MAWWRIHIPIHSIWRLPNTWYMCDMDVGTIPHGFGASTTLHSIKIKASFSTKQWPRIWAEDFPNLDLQVWWKCHDDGSISPSTAYEVCQTPVICLAWMREPFHMDFEPQPLHKGFFQHQAVTQDLSWLPKSGPGSVVLMAWWWIHIPIHSIWRLSNTWYMCDMDVGTIPHGFGASTTAQRLLSAPSSDPGFQPTSQIWLASYDRFPKLGQEELWFLVSIHSY